MAFPRRARERVEVMAYALFGRCLSIGKPLEILTIERFPAGGRRFVHTAEDVLLDFRGQIGGAVLAHGGFAFDVHLHLAKRLEHHFAAAERVAVEAGAEVALDGRHLIDHGFQVGVMKLHDLELEVDGLGFVAERGLLGGESFHLPAGTVGDRSAQPFAPRA